VRTRRLVEVAWLTENSFDNRIGGIAVCSDPQLPIDSSPVDQLYAGIVAKVISTDDGRTLPPSTPGEIYVKGPVTPVGYYNDPAATRDLLTADGWMRTGDLGLIREDGRVVVIDRLKVSRCRFLNPKAVRRTWVYVRWVLTASQDLIKVRGSHVSATELEDIIMTNPNVKEVAVIGVAV
jgi:acyl-CoA synthetase (AMP-forming)/AMP-acid ligase II